MIVRLSFCHSARLLGSKTAQRMPSWIDSSRKRKSRRMLTYCQLRVGGRRARAPQHRPAAVLEHLDDVDAQQVELALLDQAHRRSTPSAPLTISLAGALCTPRVASLRAIDAAHVAATAAPGSAARVGRHDAQPRAVERGVAARRVEAAPLLFEAAGAEERRAAVGSRAPRSGRPAARSGRSAPAAPWTSVARRSRAVGHRDEVHVVDARSVSMRGGEVAARSASDRSSSTRRLRRTSVARRPRAECCRQRCWAAAARPASQSSRPPGSSLTTRSDSAGVSGPSTGGRR